MHKKNNTSIFEHIYKYSLPECHWSSRRGTVLSGQTAHRTNPSWNSATSAQTGIHVRGGADGSPHLLLGLAYKCGTRCQGAAQEEWGRVIRKGSRVARSTAKPMGLLPGKTPAARRNCNEMIEFSGESESLSDYFFGFSEEAPDSPESSSGSSHGYDDFEEEEEEAAACNAEEKKAFWESQKQLLQVISILNIYQYLFFSFFVGG